MGVDFENEHGQYEQLNWTSWGHVIILAVFNGWVPAGVRPPEDWDETLEFQGGYGTNDGQQVVPEDAAALADALERALPGVPDHEVPHEDLDDEEAEAAAWFSGNNKQKLIQLIAYFRQGGFAIY